jgi:Secretion system C-terminal sorting domain
LKNIFAFYLCIICVLQTNAQQTYKWTGLNSNWQLASSWTPSRNIPAANDILIFDGAIIPSGSFLLVNNFAIINDIGQLKIINNAKPLFYASSVHTFKIGAGIVGEDFLLETGSKLTLINSVDNVWDSIILLTGNTGIIADSLVVDGTGTTNIKHSILVKDVYSLVVQSTGTIITQGKFTGSLFGTSITPETGYKGVKFESGSKYINKAGATPFGASQPNSMVDFFFGSFYIHNQNSAISLSGRTYANLTILNTTTTTTEINSDCIIKNNFLVDGISIVFNYSPTIGIASPGNIIVRGDIKNANGGNFLFGANANGYVVLNGTTLQNIGNSGQQEIAFNNIEINNTAGATILNNTTITKFLKLTNGIINTTATTLISLTQTTTQAPIISNTSGIYFNLNNVPVGRPSFGVDNSYINGPLKINCTGGVFAAFPVGAANIHRPLFLNNATGIFTVTYIKAVPPNASFIVNPGIDHVSRIEYWKISVTGANPSAIVELSFDDVNSGGVTNMNDLRVAQKVNVPWFDITASSAFTIGTAGSNGSVISNAITTFTNFTLASSTLQNPLPLFNFKLSITSSFNNNLLQWNALLNENIVNYVIQKSNNTINIEDLFTKPNDINILNNYTHYTVKDDAYYRIKAVKATGEVKYSNWVKTYKNIKIDIYPNPATDYININYSDIGIAKFYTTNGKLLKTICLQKGNNTINIKDYANGYYAIKFFNKLNELISIETFIK